MVLVVVSGLLVGSTPASAQDAVSLDHVDGLAYAGAIGADVSVTLYVRLTVATDGVLPYNGHVVYSPDGAVWDPPEIDTAVNGILTYLSDGVGLQTQGADGMGEDTLVFYGRFTFFGPGLPAGWDEVAYKISTGLDEDQIGKTLCVDSTFVAPAGPWEWQVLSTGGAVVPSWDGPHCFDIVPCCQGERGNIDYVIGPAGPVDIADLAYLVDYLFRGSPPPPCLLEGNFDGDPQEEINVADITALVDWLHRGGPPAAPCP